MPIFSDYYGLNRTMCDVLREMRAILDHMSAGSVNTETLFSLIEEVQSMGNRMEAALADNGDLKSIKEDISKFKEEARQLKKEIAALEKEKEVLSEEQGYVSDV